MNPPHNSAAGATPAGAGVAAKALQRSVADLQQTRPGPGLVKTAVLITAIAVLTFLTFRAAAAGQTALFLAFAVLTALVVSPWFITTHDALHHTLTGWRWFDELIPRLVAYPLNWPHGTYAEVHKLHHKMNGDDFNDPERVQWTEAEYAAAGPLGRFYVRHQWAIDLFVIGGYGLIFQTLARAASFARRSKTMRRRLAGDLIGIVAANVVLYGVAYHYGLVLEYFVFWIINERIVGAIQQARAHVEHYGIWGKGRHYFETQALSCRNLTTSAWASWYFNHLNFHSVHHAFPKVPFYNLEAAHQRFHELYAAYPAGHKDSLIQEELYSKSMLRLARAPTVIGAVDPSSPTGRRLMVDVRRMSGT